MPDDPLDRALAFGQGFDWLSPLWYLLTRRGRRDVAINADYMTYVDGVCRENGIQQRHRTLGIGSDRNTYYFTVSAADYEILRYLMGWSE